MVLAATPLWLHDLFSEALLLDRVEPAREWVENTGCILMDLLDDDALTDLVEHLGLRKYEAKRLRKALKMISPDGQKSVCTSPVAKVQSEQLGDSIGSENLGHQLDPTSLSNSSSTGKISPRALPSHLDLQAQCQSEVDDAEPEPCPERFCQSPVLFSGSREMESELSLLVSPIQAMGDETEMEVQCPSPFKIAEEARRDGDNKQSPVEEANLSLFKEVQVEALEPSSPRKALARHLLEQMESVESSTDTQELRETSAQALGSIGATFKNAGDVFAAFESFGPGAVAMFEFDEAVQKFGLSVEAENIFKELGIRHDSHASNDGVQQCIDAFESGTIKKKELQQFLATFLGDVPRHDQYVDKKIEPTSPQETSPPQSTNQACSHCKTEGQAEEALPATQEFVACRNMAADDRAFVPTASIPMDASHATQEFIACWNVLSDDHAFAPTTSIETTIILSDASTKRMQLQKRVVNKCHPAKRAVIAFELWEKNGIETELLAQLDASHILEIQPMSTVATGDESLMDVSFIVTANADGLFYLRPGKCGQELFHSLDTAEGNRLSLHVATGQHVCLQKEAKRFFDGLRLLARLPAADLQRLTENHSQKMECEKAPDKQGQAGTLKVDLSHILHLRSSKAHERPAREKSSEKSISTKTQQPRAKLTPRRSVPCRAPCFFKSFCLCRTVVGLFVWCFIRAIATRGLNVKIIIVIIKCTARPSEETATAT
jgi:hypothetical protein